jgi:epoxyqueuosine reductase
MAAPPITPDTLAARLESAAKAHGFAAFGIARADAAPRTRERLRDWLDAGCHGDMLWMESRADERGSPAGLWGEVRSVIMLGMSYAPATDPLALAGEPARGRISVYAQGVDYHDVVKRALKAVARELVALVPDAGVKVFVDTAPVMEKPLAEAAGLGWQPQPWQLAVSGSDLHNARSAAIAGGARPLRVVQCLPERVPD